MARTVTYFLSDLHLGARYLPDRRAHERRVVDFLRSIHDTAEAVYLVGDVLDYWYEYRTVVPRGYVRFFGALAELADAGVRITWLIGNHDIWLFDYLRNEIGMEVVDCKGASIERNIDGTLFFLGHGDNMGRQPASYRMLRALFHNRLAQRIYAFVPPAWTIPFAHGWSSHSRKAAEYQADFTPDARTNLFAAARQMSADNPELRYIVVGHYHVALSEDVGPHCRLIILGNWINLSTYAVFDGTTLQLKEY